MTAPPDLQPGIPQRLDSEVTRIVAPNAGMMTGAGTNTYLVGTREVIVVDPGPDDESHVQAISNAGAGRITWILCTHTHFDHAPAAARLKALTGAKIAVMSAPLTDHDCRLDPDRSLAPDDLIQCDGMSLRAVHTPGHASNHVCFLLSSNRMLFTGDHIMQGSTVVIWPPDGNMRAYLDSLRRLLALDIRVLAPGHGYLIESPHTEVERLIQHRLRREDKVRQAVLRAGEPATIEMLLPRAYDDVPKVLHEMAALSLRAHLDKLTEDGEIGCSDGRYSGR
ncbi:MAG: hydrolase:Beta-lactamase-like protein [Gammaproteobacteria bacterium]|nr:hydrolase:Beta-lactamase-like protein [Gammaproteobacteria bacterium]